MADFATHTYPFLAWAVVALLIVATILLVTSDVPGISPRLRYSLRNILGSMVIAIIASLIWVPAAVVFALLALGMLIVTAFRWYDEERVSPALSTAADESCHREGK